MARANTKIGDVFWVRINDVSKKFFQLIAFDSTQLNSDVIRVFKEAYPIEDTPEISEIIKGEVDFYAHCVTKLGLKMMLWEIVGNSLNIGELSIILFRGSSDSGSISSDTQMKVSFNWYVWQIGDANFTRVGKLEGENKKAELGLVVNPYDITERIKTGKYSFFYPSFE